MVHTTGGRGGGERRGRDTEYVQQEGQLLCACGYEICTYYISGYYSEMKCSGMEQAQESFVHKIMVV